jgi:hypothetical protein
VDGTVKMTGFQLTGVRHHRSAGDVLTSDASGYGTWQPAPGDISSVAASTGLTGGGTEGDVAIAIQIPLVLTDSAMGEAAIKGVNLHQFGWGVAGESSNGNYGFLGGGFYAVQGVTESGYAVWGEYQTTPGYLRNVGYLGGDSVGVYGTAYNSDLYAGYFDGKTRVGGELAVGEDGSGHDVNFYGDESGGRLYWNQQKAAL